MAFDRTTNEWHLTPGGWVRGNYYVFSNLQGEEKAPPEDRVETWERDMKQASGFSREVVRWNRSWFDPDQTEEERDALRKKFGERPSDA